MSTVAEAHETTRSKRLMPWIGWLFSLGAVSILLMSARWKLTSAPFYVSEWGRIGWDASALPLIATIQLVCVVLYLTPRTAVLGVVLLTGYLGGAISTQMRIGSPLISTTLFPVYIGLLVWVGLFLREDRLHPLIPLRRPRPNS